MEESLEYYKRVLENKESFPIGFWRYSDNNNRYELFKMFARYYGYVIKKYTDKDLYYCDKLKFFRDAKLLDGMYMLFNGANTCKALLYCFDELILYNLDITIEGYNYSEEDIKQKIKYIVQEKLKIKPEEALAKLRYEDLANNHCEALVTYYEYSIEALLHIVYPSIYPPAKCKRSGVVFQCQLDSPELLLYMSALYLGIAPSNLKAGDLVKDKNLWVLCALTKDENTFDKYIENIDDLVQLGKLPNITDSPNNTNTFREIAKSKLQQVIIWQTS